MKRPRPKLPLSSILLCLLLAGQPMLAQGADVTARMQIEQDGKRPKMGVTNTSYAVLWLTSLIGEWSPAADSATARALSPGAAR